MLIVTTVSSFVTFSAVLPMEIKRLMIKVSFILPIFLVWVIFYYFGGLGPLQTQPPSHGLELLFPALPGFCLWSTGIFSNLRHVQATSIMTFISRAKNQQDIS